MWVLFLALASASVTDRVIAVVDAEVVLASDRTLRTDLARGAPGHAFWIRPNASIEAALVRAAAGDLSLYQPDPSAVSRRIAQLEQQLGARWPAFLERWALTPTDLRALVRKRLITENWLARNTTTSEPTAFDAELTTLLTDLERRFRVRRVPRIDESTQSR